MKYLVLVFIIFTSCNNNNSTIQAISADSSKVNLSDTITKSINVWTDKLNGSKYPLPDTIGNKPVNFYLESSKVADIAKALYKGQFRPTDSDSTTQLLSYVTTNDGSIRPFYRWCLEFIISISDGALSEYPGVPALAYATKFPKEFFDYMDKDTSGHRYRQWTEIIAYSGLENYDKKETEIESEIINKMHNNCYFCSGDTKSRIITFAKDITKSIKIKD
jgi:hypothetical protein